MLEVCRTRFETYELDDRRTGEKNILVTIRLGVEINVHPATLLVADDPVTVMRRAEKQAIDAIRNEPERFVIATGYAPVRIDYEPSKQQ